MLLKLSKSALVIFSAVKWLSNLTLELLVLFSVLVTITSALLVYDLIQRGSSWQSVPDPCILCLNLSVKLMAKHVPHSFLDVADDVINRGVPVNVVLNMVIFVFRSVTVDELASTNIKDIATVVIIIIILVVVLLGVPCKLLVNEVDVVLFFHLSKVLQMLSLVEGLFSISSRGS